MHLRLEKRNGVWTSAEVYTTETPGYGRFEFEITTRLDRLDPNVVLGLFTYPSGGLDGQHEIDIEFARFGNAAAGAPNLNYVVYPATKLTTTQGRCALAWDVPAAPSVHRFVWSATDVAFQSFATNAMGSTTTPYRSWRFVPTGAFAISNGAWPLHLNLWLYGGRPPLNDSPVEIVIRRVTVSASPPSTVAPSTTCR
jgi:hypothetical protein